MVVSTKDGSEDWERGVQNDAKRRKRVGWVLPSSLMRRHSQWLAAKVALMMKMMMLMVIGCNEREMVEAWWWLATTVQGEVCEAERIGGKMESNVFG